MQSDNDDELHSPKGPGMSALTALIRDTVAEHPDDTHDAVARIVAEATPADDLCSFYVEALTPLVAACIRLSRNAALNNKQGKSPKLDDRRAWWRRVLRERVHVGDHRFVTIAECTIEDLEFCITERAEAISKLHSQIAKYEAIRAAMLEHGVCTAAELPDDAVQL
jgi:hypothetical protein